MGDEPCGRGLDEHDADVLLLLLRRAERLGHELLNVLRGNPGSAQADLNLAGLQVAGQRGGQGVHVGLVGRIVLRRSLGHPELAPDIA